MSIVVTIPFSKLREITYSHEAYIVNCLKDAGIPVLGVLVFMGLKHGEITRFDDIKNDSIVYTWQPTANNEVIE